MIVMPERDPFNDFEFDGPRVKYEPPLLSYAEPAPVLEPVEFTGQLVEGAAAEIRDYAVAAVALASLILLLVTSPATIALAYRAGF